MNKQVEAGNGKNIPLTPFEGGSNNQREALPLCEGARRYNSPFGGGRGEVYIAPHVEVIEMEMEGAILSASDPDGSPSRFDDGRGAW